ncbi:MAG: HD-GYP domain-containing protein [Solirubrobacterales bacterium]|nr:HD-GYP domain-containing protein [Solirubrobacterales bacterium]
MEHAIRRADIQAMSFRPTLEEQELLADTLRREMSGMTSRDRVAETLVGIGFCAAAAALMSLRPPHAFPVAPACLCFVLLVLATRVRFDTPFGATVGTQLAFVPLVFAMPVTLVPFAVVAALVISRAPEVLAGRVRPSRLALMFGNSWFAIGPVVVFVAAGVDPQDAGPWVLLAALGAQFLVDFGAFALRSWIARGADLRAQLESNWVFAIDALLSGIAIVIAEDIHSNPLAALAVIPALGLLAMFARVRQDHLGSLLELSNAYHGTALLLGDVVEADDGYTGNHCKSVVLLTLEVGDELGVSPEQRRNLEFGALLHDVGKIAIPKEILNKPDKLDPDEWATMKTHTIEGQKMLDRVGGFMHDVGLIVRSHHERWDGQGYPDGLAAAEIPIESRIIACCDAWNAMVTDRPYRKALSFEAAVAELQAQAGTQFDRRVVGALLRVVGETLEPRGARVVSSEAEIGATSPAIPSLAELAS